MAQRLSPMGGLGAETNIRTNRPVDPEKVRQEERERLEQVIDNANALASQLLLPGSTDGLMLEAVINTLRMRVDQLALQDPVCQALTIILSAVGESVYSGADKASRELVSRFGPEFAREFYSARPSPDTGNQS